MKTPLLLQRAASVMGMHSQQSKRWALLQWSPSPFLYFSVNLTVYLTVSGFQDLSSPPGSGSKTNVPSLSEGSFLMQFEDKKTMSSSAHMVAVIAHGIKSTIEDSPEGALCFNTACVGSLPLSECTLILVSNGLF